MNTIKKNDQILKGGEFLIKETPASEVFIREEFGEEQMMMLSATEEFSEKVSLAIFSEDKAVFFP